MENQDTLATLLPGCYIDESAGSADMLNERIIEMAIAYGWDETIPEAPEDEDDTDAEYEYSDTLNELADEAVDWLNDQENRPYCFWTVDDNSLFLSVNVEDARDACGYVGEDDPTEDYRGEWLHVNDHGNVTLYVRGEDGKDKEIWSVV